MSLLYKFVSIVLLILLSGLVATGFVYSGPQKVDHSGYLHLLRLFPSQPP